MHLQLNCGSRQVINFLVSSDIVLAFIGGWGCTSKPPNPKYSKGVALIVERKVNTQSANECELRIGLLNNTHVTLDRRTVKYRVYAEDFNTSIVEGNYQADSPIKPGQAGDKKVFKVKSDCSSGVSAQFLELKASELFGITYKPEKYPEIPVDVCEDAENTKYLFRNCKTSILD